MNIGPVSVSVVVPTYQEAANLPGLIDRLSAVRADWPGSFELLISDDDSQDGAAELVADLGLPGTPAPRWLVAWDGGSSAGADLELPADH